jgi:hypothetical protein
LYIRRRYIQTTALREAIARVTNATLAIRRASKRNQRPSTRDSITHLDGIAHRPDVRVAGLEVFIDPYAPQLADLQTGFSCQTRFGFYTQPEHDRIRGQPLTAFQHHDGGAGGLLRRLAKPLTTRLYTRP